MPFNVYSLFAIQHVCTLCPRAASPQTHTHNKTQARKFRRGSKKVLPTEASTYQARLTRSLSGAAGNFGKAVDVREGTESSSDSSSDSTDGRAKQSGDVENVIRDLDDVGDAVDYTEMGAPERHIEHAQDDVQQTPSSPHTATSTAPGLPPPTTEQGTSAATEAGRAGGHERVSTKDESELSANNGVVDSPPASSLGSKGGRETNATDSGEHLVPKVAFTVVPGAPEVRGIKDTIHLVGSKPKAPNPIANVTRVHPYSDGGLGASSGRGALRTAVSGVMDYVPLCTRLH